MPESPGPMTLLAEADCSPDHGADAAGCCLAPRTRAARHGGRPARAPVVPVGVRARLSTAQPGSRAEVLPGSTRCAPTSASTRPWFPPRNPPGDVANLRAGRARPPREFPMAGWASPAALLQQRLQRAYPDRNVEVINTAMAAVTSYVLLDCRRDHCQQPDAVVIYTGHNEYLASGASVHRS